MIRKPSFKKSIFEKSFIKHISCFNVFGSQAYVTFYARHLFKKIDLELYCLVDHVAYYLARKISVFLLVSTVFLRYIVPPPARALGENDVQVHDDSPRK